MVTAAMIKDISQQIEDWLANHYSGACPVRDILSRAGDKWSVLIVLRLGLSSQRFRALQRDVEGISQRMLTVTLRSLERDGLVRLEVFDTRPPSVEYSLTDLGFSLVGPIGALAHWALDNRLAIEAARLEYKD